MDQGSKQRPSPRSLSQAFMQVWISIFGGIILFFFILFFGRVLMAKLQCEIEPPCWHSLDRSASIFGSGHIILIYDDVFIDHQCYFDNRRHHQPHNNYHHSRSHHHSPQIHTAQVVTSEILMASEMPSCPIEVSKIPISRFVHQQQSWR